MDEAMQQKFESAKTAMLANTKPFDIVGAFEQGWQGHRTLITPDLIEIGESIAHYLNNEVGVQNYSGPSDHAVHWVREFLKVSSHVVGSPPIPEHPELLAFLAVLVDSVTNYKDSAPLDMLIFCPNCGKQTYRPA